MHRRNCARGPRFLENLCLAAARARERARDSLLNARILAFSQTGEGSLLAPKNTTNQRRKSQLEHALRAREHEI